MTQDQRSVQGKPIGVMVISMLALMWSIPAFFQALSILAFGSDSPITQGGDPGTAGTLVSLVGFGVAIAYFVVGYGLWQMAKWGLYLAVAISIIHVVVNVVGALAGGPTWTAAAVESIVPAIMIVYLLRPGVRRAFRV